MVPRDFDALLIDLDGTLVSDTGEVRPRNLESLRRLHADGVRVMLATGRSEVGARPIVEELGFDTPAIVFNGAGVYCPVERRLLEERVLSDRTVECALAYAVTRDLLPVVVRAGAKYSLRPRNAHEERALAYFHGLAVVEPHELPVEHAIRVTVFSSVHPSSDALATELEAAVERPIYVTHFPLQVLADHRQSPLLVADVQPPCRGKAEGLRLLQELYGIPPERVVAIGDATNDVPMFTGAGLGVAMENSMEEALAAADRVIGSNNSDAIAQLVEELFRAPR